MILDDFTTPAAIYLKHILDGASSKMMAKAKDLRDRADIEKNNHPNDPRYTDHFTQQERDCRLTAELFNELGKLAITRAYVAMEDGKVQS